MIRSLQRYLGEVNASDSKLDLFVYSTDASGIKGRAAGVVFPTSKSGLSKAVGFAKSHNISLVPRGAGTNTIGGCVPENSYVVDMSKMNNIIEIGNDYVVVEAGVILDHLNKALGGKFLPIEPENNRACTIGGMVATNSFGRRSKEYGRMADWVISLDIIDGNGVHDTIREGKKLKHFIGMEGTTGIISRAKLKIISRPESKRSYNLLSFNTMTAMVERVQELLQDLNVTYIEYWDEFTSDMAGIDCKNHLFIEYDDDSGLIRNEDEISHLWNVKDKIDTTIRSLGFIETECPQIPMQGMDKYLYWLKKNRIPTVAQFGTNLVTSYFKAKEIYRRECVQVARSVGGKVHAMGVGLMHKEFLPKEDKDKIAFIKSHYDPTNMMNRGKLI